MPVDQSAVGNEGAVEVVVAAGQSADAYGNVGLPALATPALVGLMEQAAMHALAELIADGERTVGSVIEIVHGAPSPIGARVVVSARVQSVEGRKVWFAVEASDESGRVASGRHARFVVDDARFQARLARPRTNRDGNE